MLGHVSGASFNQLLEIFRLLLIDEGVLILAVPVIGSDFTFPDHILGSDFFHLVDLTLGFDKPGFRQPLNEKSFGNYVNIGSDNNLAVRSFFVDIPINKGVSVSAGDISGTRIGKDITENGFSVKNALIYSKHKNGMGDIMFRLQIIR